MQAQANRQLAEQKQITVTQSQVAIKTLLHASFGCILFLRSLLPEDNFGQTHLVVGDGKDPTTTSTPSASQSSDSEAGTKSSRYKIMTVKRGFSQEGDEILDYLEKGAFDALEKQYLRRMTFALYIDKEEPNNIVEAWNFDFSYRQLPGTSLSIPVLSMTESRNGQPSLDAMSLAASEMRAPTLGEVKGSIRNVIHKLISITQTLDDIPRRRFATFKLEYYPHTPEEYEPPLFVPKTQKDSKMIFSTHDVSEAPTRVKIGTVDTGYGGVSLEVHSIANALPQQNEDDDSPLVGLAPKSTNGFMSSVTQGAMHTQSSIDAEAAVLLEDAKKRNVVWDAEMKLDQAQTNSGSDDPQKYSTHPTDFNSEGLLGQRVEDGSVLPIGRYVSGKEAAEVRHVGQLMQAVMDDLEETQVDENSTAPLLPSSSIGTPMSEDDHGSESGNDTVKGNDTPKGESVDKNDYRNDVTETFERLTIGRSFADNSQIIDLETQKTVESYEFEDPPTIPKQTGQITRDSSMPRRDNEEMNTLSQDSHAENHPPLQDHTQATETSNQESDTDAELNCECAVDKNVEDYDICQCEGQCGRWIHLWCHGYHGCNDVRLPGTFRCFECRLRDSQATLLIGEKKVQEYVDKYKELALFRRALKIIEVENPPNMTEFRKLVGCTPPVAAQLWKRLDSEGFIGPEIVEQDSLGMFESRSMATRAVAGTKKTKLKKTAKTKYTKNPLLTNMMTIYFDPSEEVERKHVGLGRKRKHLEEEKNKDGNQSALLYRKRISLTSNCSNGTLLSTGRIPLATIHENSGHLPTQRNSGSQTFINGNDAMEIDQPNHARRSNTGKSTTSASLGKRKATSMDSDDQDATPLRRSKRIKISVAQKDVDLDW